VLVPEKITEEEYQKLMMGGTSGRPSDAELTFNDRRDILVDHRALDFDHGLPESHFAEILAGARPPNNDTEALARWKLEVGRERKALHNAHGKKSYKGVLCDKQAPTGRKKAEWRWFIVKPEPSHTTPGLDAAAPVDPATLLGNRDHDNGIQFQVGTSATGYPS
jgi:hypothetical protein